MIYDEWVKTPTIISQLHILCIGRIIKIYQQI